MGFFGDMMNHAAGAVGEMGRIYRTQRREERELTDERRQFYAGLIQQAEAGNAAAMATLAIAYYEGTELHYDPQEARDWWTKAAEAGHVDSMYNLGLLYRGDLSKHFYNDELAVYWLTQASEHGYREAWDALNEAFKFSPWRQKWVRK